MKENVPGREKVSLSWQKCVALLAVTVAAQASCLSGAWLTSVNCDSTLYYADGTSNMPGRFLIGEGRWCDAGSVRIFTERGHGAFTGEWVFGVRFKGPFPESELYIDNDGAGWLGW